MSTDPVFAAFCAAGLWPGLGRTLAGALEGAGIEAPADVNATNLAALPKVGPTRAGRLLSAFIAAAPVYEVVELLVPASVEARIASRVVDVLGPPASRLLRDDPWLLLSVSGLSPSDADRLARVAIPGVRRDDPRRARALVGYVLARVARDGHTLAPRDAVEQALGEFGTGDPREAVDAAVESASVIAIEDGEQTLLGLARFVEAEDGIAEGIARLVSSAEPIAGDLKRAESRSLDEAQRSAVTAALRSGVSVLTGGPGTGKSRTVAAIVSLAEHAGKSVALAAPTGRAAKRLEELCDSPASTIHRLLGAQPRQSADGVRFDGGFARGSDWPLDEALVVVDEASMLDVELADALVSACADGTHLVFVGDAAQLPSIGPGRVLGDLIDSGTVPVTELTTLYRQAEGGTIARLATAVRSGELPPVEDPTREVVVVAARGSADAAHRVVQLVTDSIPRALGIPSDQVQVVTPVHRGGAGTQGLNAALKAKLNPGPGRFDVGDRVVATANHLEAEPFGYANGEVGVVADVERGGTVTVDFASGPAEVKGKALADLLHGWAITVHRAQGSEFPAVVVVIPPEAAGMLSRPLVYTALTRAQRHLSVVHAAGPALARAVRQVGTLPRRTRLKERLAEYLPT
ncbi:MAG: Exodeoxyribonuclease [Pseudonocardiales bacterium]|nr:Exodeoxyribonuclease [Pseudonocardiales bacterium]